MYPLLFALLAFCQLHSLEADPSLLPLEEKVPMLFMIADYGDEERLRCERPNIGFAEAVQEVDDLVSTKRVGGVLFKGAWTPTGLKERILYLSSLAKAPLVFAQDLEWGLSMRHYGTVELPKALCIGAIDDDALVEKWAEALAASAKEVGLTLFLGPVADVNSNPNNPIIHDRSFGDNPRDVSRKIAIVIRTLHRHGIATCVKHFPGHGNTSKDSHTELPVVESSMAELEHVELLPFRKALECDVDCVMTAHIALPKTESRDTPASLSTFWCQTILRHTLPCQETTVVLSDDLIMAGARGTTPLPETAVRAVRAGNDLCILSDQYEQCFDAIVNAVQEQRLSAAEIDAHARRVFELQCRYQRPKESSSLCLEAVLRLSHTLYQQALTNVGERWTFSPESTLILHVGSTPLCSMVRNLIVRYPDSALAAISKAPRHEEIDGVLRALGTKKELLVVLCDLERAPVSFGITPALIKGLQKLYSSGCTLRYVIFGSPYALALLPQPITSALVAYEKMPGAEQAALDALCGSFRPTGKLPVAKTGCDISCRS